jgi:beta-lactamase superfamily II metal-dependent hydrolase
MTVRGSLASGLDVEMLPARQGDAILLSWGAPDDRHHMLVDGGPAPAYDEVAARLSELTGRGLDLLVLTHIDGDHIEGPICAVNDADLKLPIGEIWFNGSHHLVSELGPVQGEIFGALIGGRNIPWNSSFGESAVCAAADGPFPTKELADGLCVTVLAPDAGALRRLRDLWLEACKEAGLDFNSPEAALRALRSKPKLLPGGEIYLGPMVPDVRDLARSRKGADTSVANASSIVLLVEYGDECILLAGDSTPAALTPPIKRLLADRQVTSLALTAFKLPHHGSAKNINAELVRLLPAHHYLFSTDGSYFNHPNDEAVATVIEHSSSDSELVFNYDTLRTRQWDQDQFREQYGLRVRYPPENSAGVVLALGSDPS